MEFDVIKYALEVLIRRHDIDDDVKSAAKVALKNQTYLHEKHDKLLKAYEVLEGSCKYVETRRDKHCQTEGCVCCYDSAKFALEEANQILGGGDSE